MAGAEGQQLILRRGLLAHFRGRDRDVLVHQEDADRQVPLDRAVEFEFGDREVIGVRRLVVKHLAVAVVADQHDIGVGSIDLGERAADDAMIGIGRVRLHHQRVHVEAEDRVAHRLPAPAQVPESARHHHLEDVPRHRASLLARDGPMCGIGAVPSSISRPVACVRSETPVRTCSVWAKVRDTPVEIIDYHRGLPSCVIVRRCIRASSCARNS